MTDRGPLERRLRRVAMAAVLLGLAGAIVSPWPDRYAIGATLLFAPAVAKFASRAMAFLWPLWGVFVGFVYLVEVDDLYRHHDGPGVPAWASAMIGAMMLLIFPVTPLVALLSSRKPPPDGPPSAIVVSE